MQISTLYKLITTLVLSLSIIFVHNIMPKNPHGGAVHTHIKKNSSCRRNMMDEYSYVFNIYVNHFINTFVIILTYKNIINILTCSDITSNPLIITHP